MDKRDLAICHGCRLYDAHGSCEGCPVYTMTEWQTRAVEVLRKLYCDQYGNIYGIEGDGGCYYCDHCDNCTAQVFMDDLAGENVVEGVAALMKEADHANG